VTPAPAGGLRAAPSVPGAIYPRRWEMDAILTDGGTVHVRPIRPEDAEALVDFHELLSPETRYLRFFSAKRHLTEADVERFTRVDYRDRFALVAVLGDKLIGVGRYDRVPGTTEAEVAFVVADAHQRRGVGTLLLEYLGAAAAEYGISRFIADTLPRNTRMLDVFHHAGYQDERHFADGVVRVSFDITPTPSGVEAVERREWSADVRSIKRLLEPRSIAVIGAGRSPDNIGHAVLRNLVEGGFAGPVHPVNPHAAEIAGLAAYRSVSDIPVEVDLAVIAVPAAAAVEVVDDCAAMGVRGLVVISSGFAEIGAAGADLERRLVERAHLGGMRLIGPNCIGAINTDPGVRMNATFAGRPPVTGRVAFASQSGALGIALLEKAEAMGLGLSSFVSMGNKADVSGNDLLRYWEQDPATAVILLYLESFGNPRMFSRVARHVALRKPIVAVKSGRTSSGVRAAASHTASMATPDTAVEALFQQTGVIRVDTLEELFDVGGVLARQPLPRGGRVAVIGNAGGAGILAADACEAAGLQVPELSTTTQAALRTAIPGAASVSNPVDLGAGAGARDFAAALAAGLRSPDVDSVITVYARVPGTEAQAVADHIAGVTSDSDKPVLATFLAMDEAPDGGSIPSFAYPEAAARSLARVTAYARWRRRPVGTVAALEGIEEETAHSMVEAELVRPPAGGWMDASQAAALLQTHGIAVAPTMAATTADEAVAAARTVGFPVALKAQAEALVHKSDVGGVILNLADEDAVAAAFDEMRHRLGATMRGVVVQGMVPPGVETIVGVVNDPLFGPLLMFGSGGTTAELLGDRSFRVLPLTDLDARDLVRSTRGSPLLFGYRGAAPCDVAALESLLLRVARLAENLPQVTEMDLNPVIVSATGAVAVDAKVRLTAWQVQPELGVRRLRPASPRHG